MSLLTRATRMTLGLSLLLAAGCACFSGREPPASASTTIPTAAPPSALARPEMAPLDLTSMATRLQETRAVGAFTRISLGNQADDVFDQFRVYHSDRTPPLAELRQSYTLFLLKVLSLLQDSDPALARDIVASREAIWDTATGPKKFTESTT